MAKMASFVVEEGYGVWLVGGRICPLLVIAATTNDGPFQTRFGLFAGPRDARKKKRGSCSALMSAPTGSIFGGTYASKMA
jgi:hypothetical protein